MFTELNLGSPAAMPKDADPRTFCEIYYLDITKKDLSIEKIVTITILYHKIHTDLAMAKAEYLEKKEHPKIPSGFQCFVCGKQFSTNKERVQHLEEESHDSMHDTATPQETEDTRRLE
jgi:hypothetical protein